MERISKDSSELGLIKFIADHCQTLFDVFYFVGISFEYQPDEGQQTYRRPERLIKEGRGNCVDASILTSSILRCLNLPHVLKFGAIQANKPIHVWVECGGKIIDTVKNRSRQKTKFDDTTFDSKQNFPYIYIYEIKF